MIPNSNGLIKLSKVHLGLKQKPGKQHLKINQDNSIIASQKSFNFQRHYNIQYVRPLVSPSVILWLLQTVNAQSITR